MKTLKDRPFALLGVHVGGSTVKELGRIMEKEKITWRSFADVGNAGAGPIAAKWNLSATPTFYVIDHAGVIRHKWAGPPGEQALEAALENLIRAATRRDGPPPLTPLATPRRGRTLGPAAGPVFPCSPSPLW